MLAWLSVWSEVQTCILHSRCHCHPLSLAPVKSRLILPLWYRLTWVVLDKGALNGCVCVSLLYTQWHYSYSVHSMQFLSRRQRLTEIFDKLIKLNAIQRQLGMLRRFQSWVSIFFLIQGKEFLDFRESRLDSFGKCGVSSCGISAGRWMPLGSSQVLSIQLLNFML